MRRFFGNKDFKTAFDPEGGGFVQDLPTSGYGFRNYHKKLVLFSKIKFIMRLLFL
jgi:hypothetical protein